MNSEKCVDLLIYLGGIIVGTFLVSMIYTVTKMPYFVAQSSFLTPPPPKWFNIDGEFYLVRGSFRDASSPASTDYTLPQEKFPNSLQIAPPYKYVPPSFFSNVLQFKAL